MKGTLALFGELQDRGVAAFFRDGVLEDLLVDPPADRIRPGAIYRARVGRLMKGLGGAILETPDGNVFLRSAKGLRQGQTCLVQVVSFAEQGKAAPVTTRTVFKSRFCLATPGAPGLNLSRDIKDEERRVAIRSLLSDLVEPEIGLVVRSQSAEADDEDVLRDAEATMSLAKSVSNEGARGAPELLLDGPDAATLGWREWQVPDATETGDEAFRDHEVESAVNALKRPYVQLKGGGSLVVEPTRALVAVDVNTGGDSSPAAALKTNLAAAAELPRALRLRGLGGQVIVDFVPMAKKDRRQLETALRRSFRADPIETSLVGWTTLGLFEIQRKRERLALRESLSEVLV